MSFIILIHGALAQGSPFEPKSLANRIVFLAIYILGLLMIVSYSACLTSILAVRRDEFPFTDSYSMYHKSDYNLLAIHGSTLQHRLQVNILLEMNEPVQVAGWVSHD
jgi:hypothetical protein